MNNKDFKFNISQYTNNTPTLQLGKKEDNQLCLLVEKALVKYGEIVPKPDSIITINQNGYSEADVFTKGSISTIIGKAKSGKTAFTSIIIRAILNGSLKGEYTSLLSKSDKKLLVFDTEQGQYYASTNLHRIGSQSRHHMDRLIYYDLRPHSPTVRFDMIKYALEQNKDDIDFVLIDGIRDITYDINSSDEAITVVSELMKLSVNYDIHISTVLHQNKGDSNARGHLGTECTNKSEIVISVEKDDSNDCSVIDAVYTRGIGFKPFSIKRTEQGVPYIDGNVISKSAGKRKRSHEFEDISDVIHIEVLKEVFSKESIYMYTPLMIIIKTAFKSKGYTLGDNKVKAFISKYQHNTWVIRDKRMYNMNENITTTPF